MSREKRDGVRLRASHTSIAKERSGSEKEHRNSMVLPADREAVNAKSFVREKTKQGSIRGDRDRDKRTLGRANK